MKKYQKQFRIVKMAQVLDASLHGYYRWIRMGCPDEKTRDREMIDAIRNVQQENSYRTGSPRVHKELKKKGHSIGRNKVARLMSENDLSCRTKRAYIRTTVSDPKKKPAPNLLQRDFVARAPDTKWVSDITYVRTVRGWAYLCVIIDLYSRRVVGWSLSKKIDAQLVINTLRQAYRLRGSRRGLIFHSDRGSQYTSDAVTTLLGDHGAVQSMSRKGDPWYNAVAESFFSALKVEELHRTSLYDIDEAEFVLTNYIEVYYNRKRIHSSIGMVSPVDYEEIIQTKCA